MASNHSPPWGRFRGVKCRGHPGVDLRAATPPQNQWTLTPARALCRRGAPTSSAAPRPRRLSRGPSASGRRWRQRRCQRRRPSRGRARFLSLAVMVTIAVLRGKCHGPLPRAFRRSRGLQAGGRRHGGGVGGRRSAPRWCGYPSQWTWTRSGRPCFSAARRFGGAPTRPAGRRRPSGRAGGPAGHTRPPAMFSFNKNVCAFMFQSFPDEQDSMICGMFGLPKWCF